MGVDLSIENESGESIQMIGDGDNGFYQILASSDLSKTQLLKFIDFYGDTTFNHLQFSLLIEELNKISGCLVEPKLKDKLSNLITLIQNYKGKAHIYLKFYGD